MNTHIPRTLLGALAILIVCGCNSQIKNNENAQSISEQVKVFMILGSTRQGRTSDKIAHVLNKMLENRTDISTQIIDLRDYQLPFLYDSITPASRKVITDPFIQRWSDKIMEADAFIIITPVYNAGYPAVLKNALDLLYKEWGGKPVGFVGYSGGPSGGAEVISQFDPVMRELKMIPITTRITIPTVWKAFDQQGNLLDTSIPGTLDTMVNELIANIPGR